LFPLGEGELSGVFQKFFLKNFLSSRNAKKAACFSVEKQAAVLLTI